MNTKIIVFLIIVLLTQISCSKDIPSTTKIKIIFSKKESNYYPPIKHNLVDTKTWGLSDPTSINEITCFGIFVTYPELAKTNKCLSENAPLTIVSEPHKIIGTIAANTEVSAEILNGENRIFQVIGFKSDIACPVFIPREDWPDSIEQKMSSPFILGKTIQTINPATTTVVLNATLSDSIEIGDCSGVDFVSKPATALWDNAIWDNANWN